MQVVSSVCISCAWTHAIILAQTATVIPSGDSGGWLSLIGSFVNIGFSAVVGWYLLTKALPEMQVSFRAELASQRAEATVREKERREADRESLKMVIDHCEREGARNAQILKEEISSSAKVINDSRETLEEVRDALREVKSVLKEVARTAQSSTNQRP